MRNATGVLFEGETVDAMVSAICRAMSLYRRPQIWQAMRHRAMTADFSWARAVPAYDSLYRSLTPAEALQRAPAAVSAPARPSLLDHVTAAARPLVGSRAGKEPASSALTAGAA